MDAAEIEFLSEDVEIKIIPQFSHSKPIHFIRGSYGPFKAGIPQAVPLFVAIDLKRKKMCTIEQPHWLTKEYLKNRLKQEKQDTDMFQPIHFHYLEIALQLLNVARDDIEDDNDIHLLLEDIENVRSRKLTKGLQKLSKPILGFRTNNISAMEINRNRDFVTKSLQTIYDKFADREESEDDDSDMDEDEDEDMNIEAEY